ASERSAFTVTNKGLSGRWRACALEAGRSTETSTVASGAAIMKMISSTRMTSMNGVTLISCTSARSTSPWSRRTLIRSLRRRQGGFPSARRAGLAGVAIEIAAYQAEHLGGTVGVERPVGADRSGEHVVDH